MVSNGKGDIKLRTSLFKNVFRVKLNNWWSSHAAKIENRDRKEEQNYEKTPEQNAEMAKQPKNNLLYLLFAIITESLLIGNPNQKSNSSSQETIFY